MKVLCDHEKLREGLAVANNVMPTKTTKPILSNVCLVATEDGLELVSTDLEVALRYRIEDVKVLEPGTAVIPARVAFEFVRDLQGEAVELETDERVCRIRSGEDSCELHVADPEEFPVVARFAEEGSFSIQAGRFTALVGRTAFAAAREQGRYAMHGVRLEVQGDELKMIATDGRRLALDKTAIDVAGQAPRNAIVPTRALQLFARVLTDPLEQARLVIEGNQIGLRTRRAEAFARLLDGEFPRYDAVLPKDKAQHRLETTAEQLASKIRLVANVTGDEAHAVKLSLSNNRLDLFCQSASKGEARATMEVEFSGEAEIAFNPDYVIEGLKNSQTGQVTLEFNDRTSPGRFKLGEDYIYIVMPITVDV